MNNFSVRLRMWFYRCNVCNRMRIFKSHGGSARDHCRHNDHRDKILYTVEYHTYLEDKRKKVKIDMVSMYRR